MAKLPEEFVKAPAPRTASKRRTQKKSSIVTVERARDLLREVVLRLTEEEHRALDDALGERRRAGEEITLEQLIHRVIDEWMTRRRAERAAAAHGPRAIDGIVAQLRRLAGVPLRTWRELGAAAIRRLASPRAVD